LTELSPVGAVLLLLGSFAPGYLVSLTWDRSWADALDFCECVFVQWLCGLVINAWLLLLLAEMGAFRLPIILASWLVVCAILIGVIRRRAGGWMLSRPKLHWESLLLVALLLLAGFLYARPAEAFLVLDDSGIYVLSGIHLAQTGRLVAKDTVLASLTPENAGELLATGPVSANWARLWGQFFVWGWYKPWVVFGLLDMQRIWCALFTLFLGISGGLWVAPAFGIVATAGMFFLGRRLFSRAAGFLGAGLLAVNFVQIWHARYPLSEMLAQAFVVGGFYLLALALHRRHVGLAVLSGLCLGGLFLVRVDALLLGLLLFGLVAFWKFNRRLRPERAAFGLALGAALAYAGVHNVAWNWLYLVSLWQIAGGPSLTQAALAAIVMLASLLAFAVLRPRLAEAATLWLQGRMWRILLSSACALVALIPLYYWLTKITPDRGAIVWLAQYWTPLGMLLAAAGLALVLLRRREVMALPFMVSSLVYFALFCVNPMVNPIQPWAMRRFVPLVLPAMALLTAYAIVTLPVRRLFPRRVMQLLLAVVLAIEFARVDRPFLVSAEYQGVGGQLRELADKFEQGAVILFDRGDPSLHISQPLAYLYHLNPFVLQKPTPDASLIDPLLQEWQKQGTPVYLVLTGGDLDWRPKGWTLEPAGGFEMRFPRIERTVGRMPASIETIAYALDIYRIRARENVASGLPNKLRLDMGAGDYPYLAGGFYGWETTTEGFTYRWTGPVARIRVPTGDGAGALLRVRAAGGRPAGFDEVHLAVSVNGVFVAERSLPAGWSFETLEIAVPESALGLGASLPAGETLIELDSDTWQPMAAGQSADSRELGSVVDWIEWEPVEAKR
jgi:hypothetical protein